MMIKDHKTIRRVVVTGMGLVTCLGDNINLVWNNLLDKNSGISRFKNNEYDHIPSKIAGYIKEYEDSEKTQAILTNLTPHWRSATRPTLFALLATQEAVKQANINFNDNYRYNAGICIGTSMVCLNEIIETNEKFKISYNKLSPYFIPKILYNMPAGLISIKYAINGLNHCVSTACATGLHAIGDAFRFIKYGDADVIICGATEACINPLAIAGFSRLKALSTSYNHQPHKASRPFDKGRDGFVMSEGAGILILEDYEHAKMRGVAPICEVVGYGMSSDAMHVTSPSSDGLGAELCMRNAIRDAGMNIDDIGYINAHATSTPIGDLIEASAIARLFGQHSVHVSSTKGSTGHMLGAAGSTEAIFTAMACHTATLPPCNNLETIDPQIVNIHNSLSTRSKTDHLLNKRSDVDFKIDGDIKTSDVIQSVSATKVSDTSLMLNDTEMYKKNKVNTLNFVYEKGGRKWTIDKKRVALTNSFGFGGTNACICMTQFEE